MAITKEIRVFFHYLFSANRRKKMTILAKECFIGLKSYFVSNNRKVRGNLDDERVDTWPFSETRAVDVDFFKANKSEWIEERLIDGGLVEVAHDYQIHRLHGAISYTNESTHRSVFNHHGKRVEPLSYTRKGARSPSTLHMPVSRTITGTTANLYGNVAASEGNYFHWLVDAMARLQIIERFYSRDEIDQVLVPPLKHDFHWDCLAVFGFDRSCIVELPALECIEFECLLATNPPRGKRSVTVPGWVIDGYNAAFKDISKNVSSVAGKHVYVSRRDAPNRMFINEEEVCRFLERRGFDVVELSPLDLASKIAVFRDADVIISQTGAGLTNLMFCHKNATVIELVDRRFVYPGYASIAWYRGAKHRAHFFSNETVLGRANAMVSKSELNLGEFEKTLIENGL